MAALTDREQAVLRCVLRGLTDREIGEVLAISKHTVRSHVTSIAAKLPGGDELRPRPKIHRWALDTLTSS